MCPPAVRDCYYGKCQANWNFSGIFCEFAWDFSEHYLSLLQRPARGAIPARTYDRPFGRHNATRCLGNGLPRRCAPRNDRVESLWVRTELQGSFASARRGHDPALRAGSEVPGLRLTPSGAVF